MYGTKLYRVSSFGGGGGAAAGTFFFWGGVCVEANGNPSWSVFSPVLESVFYTNCGSNIPRDTGKRKHLCVCVEGLVCVRSGIDPLKTKRRQLYLKTQSVPRCKHFSSRL